MSARPRLPRPRLAWPAVAVLVAASAGAGAVRAAEAPAKPQEPLPGWTTLTGKAEARGLYDVAAVEWVRAALAAPSSPGALLALRRLEAVRERTVGSRALLKPLEGIARKEDAPPQVRFLARRLLAGCHRARGDWRAADRVARELGFLEHWLAAGTFGRNIPATHDRAFRPERAIDLAAECDPGRYGAPFKARWRPLPAPRPGEPIEPYEYFRPRRGAVYLLAQVKAEGGRFKACMSVETAAAFKVWVNDRPVLDGDRYRRDLPREAPVDVTLDRDGWNRILVKLSSPATLSVRLLDDSGEPLVLEAEKKAVLHPLGKPAVAPPGPPRRPSPLLPRALMEDRSVAGRAALGTWYRLQGMDDAALRALAEAAAAEPRRAAWHFLLGEVARGAAHLSPPSRRNRAARAYRACLKIDPGFVPALMRLAELEWDESREEEALLLLEKAVGASPGCYLARLRMAEIAADLGWRVRALAWLAEAQKLRPDYAGCRLLEARLQREGGQLDRAIASLRELVKEDQSDAAGRRSLAEAMGDRGLWRDAVKVCRDNVRLRPRGPRAHLLLAEVLTAAGRLTEAAAALKPLIGLVPREAAHHRALGEVLARSGDRKGSLEAYSRALELNPGDHRLRRLVERGGGIDEDFSAPYALDIRKEIADSRKRAYPRANAVRVLDQTVVRVYPDGSMAETIANGERALTPRAVESLGEQPVLGEVMEARTIKPDGSVMEPTPIPGQRRLTMPGLAIDATVEYKYRLDRPPARWGGFYLDKWYFRSPQLDEPHQVSDYVVMIPKGMPHKVVRHNFDVPERVEKKDGLVVYRWTARNQPRVDAEPKMPHFDHYLPFVEIGTPRSWQEVADSFRSVYMGRTRATSLVTYTAARVAGKGRTVEEKARALYAWGNREVKHRGPYANAHQALEAGAGDREMVFIALAEAAGITVYQGRTRKAPQFQGADDHPATWSLPAEEHFSAEVVGVRLEGGGVLWLDLSSRFMPFGALRTELCGARVLAVPTRGPAFFEKLPAPRYDRVGSTLELDAALDPAGRLTGRAVVRVRGADAAGARERLATLDEHGRRNLLQSRLAAAFPGVTLTALKFPAGDDPEAPHVSELSFELEEHLIPAAGGRLVCPPGLKPMHLTADLAVDPSRKHPLKIARPRIDRESLRYRLAPGLEIGSLPDGKVISGEFGNYSLTVVRTADGFRVERRGLVLPQTVSPESYPRFRAFCSEVDEAEKVRVILRRKARGQ
ncbi:MAG: tetratricopeptide repeat protein [Planctomycetota bacterium]|jgi:tetratricopeptide (TPR) repeat protein